MRLSAFIRENTEQILVEWEKFARALPMGGSMDIAELRDHAKEMLEVIATDLDTPQTRRQQSTKAAGKSDAATRGEPTAAQEHGSGRAARGFSIGQMASEFRALRASVIRLWIKQHPAAATTDLEDMIRFNEAIDQAIAESISRYAADIGQSKERFLAILAHDLRTPLGAIITATKFMLDTGELGEPHLTLVTRVASSSRRMNQMVNDLLDFTRTRFGDTIPIVRVDADVRKLVHDVVAEVAASYPKSAIQVETSGDLRGQWDPERLMQTLTNLLSNAAEHGTDSLPIKVAAHGAPSEVVISVHNHGPAIPRKQIAQLFDAMKLARGDGVRDRGHLGLGLYIVDKIVAAHGGSIEVKSSRDEGTTFTLHLPRQA